jgi:hypothetical protein
MSEEIRDFHYEPKYISCIFCDKLIGEGYVWYDKYGGAYCVSCFMSYKDRLFVIEEGLNG